MRSLAVAVLVVAAVSMPGAWAVGKITVDPNGAAAAKAEVEVKTDTRLDQRVTYEARRKSVLAILSELAAHTGVRLKAGYNTKDWQVRDRKMNIFAKDLPLKDLMASIARVMKFKWVRDGSDDAPGYRLYMDRRTLLDAEARKARAEQRIQEQTAKKREKMLADFGKLDGLSPDELATLKQDAPFMYVLATTGFGGALGSFIGNVPAISDAISTGQPLSLTAGSLTPEAHEGIARLMRGTVKLVKMMTGKDDPVPQELFDNIPRYNIEVNANQGGMLESALILCGLSFKHDKMNWDFGLPDPSGKLGNAIGKLIVDASDSGRPLGTTSLSENTPGIAQAVMDEVGELDAGEKAPEHPDDPVLKTKIKLAPEGKRLDEVESALSAAAGLCVVSDNFGQTSTLLSLPREEMEIKQALEKIGQGFLCDWEKHGDVIELRDRFWYANRAAQLPEAWLDRWRSALKKTGTLDLADLGQIAALGQEQFNLNIQADDVLGEQGLSSIVFVNRGLLRLYASLDTGQRSALFADGGLDIRSLPAEQFALAEKLITRRGGRIPQEDGATVVLAGARSQKEKQFDYTFTARTPAAEALRWQFRTPKYVDPAEPPEQSKQPPTPK